MKKNIFASVRKSSAFTLLEVVVGVTVLCVALTPLIYSLFSTKVFSLVTLREIQAAYYCDEIITQMFVYPKIFLKPSLAGEYPSDMLSDARAKHNETYMVQIFGKTSPGLYLTRMEDGFDRKMSIVFDAALNLYKIKVIVTYDTFTLAGKPKKEEVKSGGVISSLE